MHEPADLARPPPFARDDFERRWARLQARMAAERLDALLVSNERNVRYLTGHAPLLSISPARAWHALLPLGGEPTVVVPEIGAADMVAEGHFGRIVTWECPNPGAADEGVDALAAAVRALPHRHGRVAMELGAETRLGPAWRDTTTLMDAVRPLDVVDGSMLLWWVRAIKTPAEIERVVAATRAARAAFDAVPGLPREALATERTLHRAFARELLAAGADSVPYLAIGSGPHGHDGLTRGPTDRPLGLGDAFALDVGCEVDGYFTDFDRDFTIGDAVPSTLAAYRTLHAATDAGLAAIRPGVRADEVWAAIAAHLPPGSERGRLGHGVGLDLTEPPSLHRSDRTALREGMVLSVEPSLAFERPDGTLAAMVHEELCTVGADGARLLTARAPPGPTRLDR